MQQMPENALRKAEKQILELIRALDDGEIRIILQDRKPIRAEAIRRSIPLTEGTERQNLINDELTEEPRFG